MDVRRGSVGLVSLVGALALLVALVGRHGPATAREGPIVAPGALGGNNKDGFADLGDLHADVSALQVLRGLRPTPRQLKALERLADKTMQPAPARKLVRASDRYRKTMRGLREALLKGDDAAVEKLHAALDKEAGKAPPELDEIELTDAARQHAPALVRNLSPRQLAGYLATVDFPDPFDQIAAGIAAARKLRGQKWTDHRDDVAYQVGWLLAGVDVKAEEKARDKVTALLNKAHTMSNRDFGAAAQALFHAAEGLARQVAPSDVLRNYTERVLAELLSNHRLSESLKAWRKRG